MSDNMKEKCQITDFASVLENDDLKDSILEELESSLRNFQLNIAAQMEERLINEKECSNKKSVDTTQMTELQQKIDAITSDTNSTTLQEEVIDKEISNVIKLQDSLVNELEEAKKKIKELSSEILALEQEIEERKYAQDAVKRAYHIYKSNLDMDVTLEEKEDALYMKINFFISDKNKKDNYFIKMVRCGNSWKVKRVEPKLRKEYFNELSNIEKFSEQFRILNLTLFLYEIRNIFLKYYRN